MSIFEEECAVILAAGCDNFLRKPFWEESILLVKHLGVEFIYAEITPLEPVKTTSALTAKQISQLPYSLLERLQQAIVASDLVKIAHCLEAISRHDLEIANILKSLLDQFEYESVLELISEESS